MNLKEIKAMFRQGDCWKVTRNSPRFVIVGNLSNKEIPVQLTSEVRRVVKIGTRLNCQVLGLASGSERNTEWPKASEIIEARPGYLKFKYTDGGVEVEFTKLDTVLEGTTEPA